MALAIDTSTLAIKGGGISTTTITSSAFSPPASSLVCAIVAGSSGGSPVTSVTLSNTGTALTWIKLVEVLNGGGADGSIGIYIADNNNAQSGITASGNMAGGAFNPLDGSISIIIFTGAAKAASQNGGTKTQSSASATPSMAVTATAAGSQIIGAWWNNTNNTAPTVPGGQSTTIGGKSQAYQDTSGSYGWCQQITAQTTGAGTYTVNDTAPTALQLWGVAAEILAAPPPASGLVVPGFLAFY